MTLNNSAANAEVNMNESTSVNENVSAVTDTPTVLPESPVIGFQAVDAEGNVLGFVSKAELVNEAKQALYADLAILEANRPTTLPANDMLADTSTLAATDVYEDQLAIKSDAPYIRGLDASGNPIRISKADLASVVGELIGVATSDKNGLASKNWCFPQKSPILPEDVIDSLSPGIYSVGAGVVNIPNSSTGVLYVDIMLSYGYKIQRFFDVKGNKLYRIYNGTNWSEWK